MQAESLVGSWAERKDLCWVVLRDRRWVVSRVDWLVVQRDAQKAAASVGR